MAIQQRERNSFGSDPAETAKDAANKAGDFAKDTAKRAGEVAKETASHAGDIAKDLASRAGDAAATVAQKTGDAASYVGQKADDATTALGGNIKSVAGTIRDKGPKDGILGAADAAVAGTLETVGNELEQGLSGMANDLTDTIRKYPVPAVLVGIGIGFVLARALTK